MNESKLCLCVHFCVVQLLLYKAFGLVALSYFSFKYLALKEESVALKGRSLGQFKTVSSTDLKLQSLRQGWQLGWRTISEIFLWGINSSFYQQNDGQSCIVKSEASGKPVLVNNEWSIVSWQGNPYCLVKCFQSTKSVF